MENGLVLPLDVKRLIHWPELYPKLAWLAFECALFSILLAYPLAYFLAFKAGRLRMVWMTLLIFPKWHEGERDLFDR